MRQKGGNWLIGGETENPNVSSSLAGFVCSPLPRREQTWLPTKPASQPHGSPAVSSGMHLVNGAPQRRRSSVEQGSTYVVVGETW